jgi:hypothetical protein
LAWTHFTADAGSTQFVSQRPQKVHFAGSICQKQSGFFDNILHNDTPERETIDVPAKTEPQIRKNFLRVTGLLVFSLLFFIVFYLNIHLALVTFMATKVA